MVDTTIKLWALWRDHHGRYHKAGLLLPCMHWLASGLAQQLG